MAKQKRPPANRRHINQVLLRLDDDQHARLTQLAERRGTTVSDVLRSAIEELASTG